MNKLSNIVRAVLLAGLCSLLVACGGSGGGGGDTTTGSGGTTAGGGTGSGTGGTDLVGADLSQAGKRLPSMRVDPSSAALFSDAGAARALALPDSLGVIFEVVENQGNDARDAGVADCKALGAEYASCSVVNLHIKDADGVLGDGDWKLYFHSIRRVLRVDSDEFEASLVNGDLNYLEPGDDFDGFDGPVETIRLVTEFSHLIESDFMPRYWLVHDGATPVLIANSDEETDEQAYAMPITGGNRSAYNGEPIPLATPATRFARNAPTSSIAAGLSAREIQARIIPRPVSTSAGTGSLDISGGVSFAGGALSAQSAGAIATRQRAFLSPNDGTPVSMAIDANLGPEAYELVVAPGGITIAGGDDAGIFYGAQSVLSLVQPGVRTIPAITVSDAPRFGFRGMHLDVARNFQSVDTVKRLLDQMAAYKLNKLHLHLSDDEGWRLDIPSIPELAAVGGRRAFELDSEGRLFEGNGLMPQLGSGPASDNAGTGFYSRAEFVDLLEYAAARHIDVIPEFDMPAHARGAVVAMRVAAAKAGMPTSTDIRIDDPADTSRYLTIQHFDDGIMNPCIPGTWTFIETVVADVAAMYGDAGASLDIWHMGGDEARNVFTGGGFEQTGGSTSFRGDANLAEWDFPWAGSPACLAFIEQTPGIDSREALQPYFVKRVSQIVADAGIPTLIAYQDIYDELPATELATQDAAVSYWQPISRDDGYEPINGFSNRGYRTIVSVPDFLYFDFPQEVDPEERGYYWAARYTDTRKVFAFAPENLPQNAETSVTNDGSAWQATGSAGNQGFAGMQAYLWGETTRNGAQVDYMAFPRLLALAERAWHRAEWELDYVPGVTYSGGPNGTSPTSLVPSATLDADYAHFAAALGSKELSKLDASGVLYRIPVPGASTPGGALDMNVEFPGLPLEYSADGSNFTRWAPGASPASVAAVRATSANGSRAGRADAL